MAKLDHLEEGRYTITSIHKDLFDINFKYDILRIKFYLINRISDNDIATINDLTKENISLHATDF